MADERRVDAVVKEDVSERIVPASCSGQWSTSSYKNPRIVRVSRSCLGGKDRHSKVCTVRGLRDRRIRLSVPTAIQLYSLQDRLGLSQPSKVVDWLLDATKHEIQRLPPLPPINNSMGINMNMLLPTSPLPFHFQFNHQPTHFGARMEQEANPNEEMGFVGQNDNNNSSASFQNPYLHWNLHNSTPFGLNFPFHTHQQEEGKDDDDDDYDRQKEEEDEASNKNQNQNEEQRSFGFSCAPHYFSSTPFLHDPSNLPPTTLRLINHTSSTAPPPDSYTTTPQLKNVESQ